MGWDEPLVHEGMQVSPSSLGEAERTFPRWNNTGSN